jgi:hypothetical protein
MLLVPFLAGVLAVPPVQSAKPEKAPALARAAPKDAFFLVQARGIDGLRSDFEAGACYAFYRDEEMKGLRDWIGKQIETHEGGEKKGDGLDVDPWAFVQAIHGSVAVFGVAQAGHKEPAVALLIDPGEPKGAFEDLFAKITDQVKKKHIPSTEEYAGVELRLYEKKSEEGQPVDGKSAPEGVEAKEGASHAKHGGTELSAVFETGGATCLAFADSRELLLDTVHGVIDRMSGKDPSNGIEGSDVLAQARGSVKKPGRIEAFLDLGKTLEMVKAEKPPDEEDQKVMKTLGVDGLRWLYASGDIGKGESATFDLAVKFPDKGYLRDWIGLLGTAPRELAGAAPRESSSVGLVQFDLWGLWQSAWKLAAEIDPDGSEEARGKMDAALENFGAADLEKSFLSQIDGRFMSFGVQVPAEEWKAALPETGDGEKHPPSASLGSAMVIGLRDAPAVSAFLDSVLAKVGLGEMVKTEEFQGTTIHKLSTGAGPGFQWAFTKKSGVLSQFPTALRAALRMEGAEKKDSALEKEAFKPLFEANASAGMLSLATTPDTLKGMLDALGKMHGLLALGMGRHGRPAGGDPFELMPSAAAIDRHFKGTLVSSVTRTGSVLHLQMSSR